MQREKPKIQREWPWRMIVVGAVTLLCIILIVPTMRYFLFIGGGHPDSTDPAVLAQWEQKRATLQAGAIPLGLDIQGGVDVVLEVNKSKAVENAITARQREVIRQLGLNGINADVTIVGTQEDAALKIVLKDPAQAQSTIDILNQYKDTYRDFSPNDLKTKGETTIQLDRSVVEHDLQADIDGALKVIRERVDTLGVTQASVAKQGQTRIRVQIPGEKDPQRVVKNIIRPAQLRFHAVHDENDRLVSELYENNGMVPAAEKDSLVKQTTAALKPGATLPAGFMGMPGESIHGGQDLGPNEKAPRVMYIVKEKEELSGDKIENAFVSFQQMDLENPIVVNIEFNKDGARIFGRVTKDMVGKRLAIALDGVIFSAPVIEEEIGGGRAIIRGNFTQDEARDLSLVLKAGALPADLEVMQSGSVEASLGADSIAASLRALAIGTGLVVIFMIFYYGTAGVIAVVALLLNVIMVLAIMRLARATLTLSGIGGILLTVGMAVDGNVLIYERIREELRGGKPMKSALPAGFNSAFSVILDSHLTTLLTALVLLQFGMGTVRGFALAMTFGLVANLYTSLTVTHALCDWWFARRGKLSLGKFHVMDNPTYAWISWRKFGFMFSGAMLLIALGTLVVNKGPYMSVEFEGGVMATTQFTPDHTAGEIDQALAANGLEGTRTQKYISASGEVSALIRSRLTESAGGGDDQGAIINTQNKISDALTKAYGADGFKIVGASSVSDEVGAEFGQISLVVTLCAAAALIMYLGYRYELVFATAAVIAVFHDLFITVGILTLLKYEITLDVVSGLMILLGFSVNDTIVIFDRIREMAREGRKMTLQELCDYSLNQTLSRTVITTLTVIFVMFAMYFLGGVSLRPFALTLLLGLFLGTYSTMFVAMPFVYEWSMRRRGGSLGLSGVKSAPKPGGRRAGGTRGRRSAPAQA